MKIVRKIKAYRDLISTSGGSGEANRLQNESVNAVLKGIGTPEWEKYMRNFHSNSEQLQRLLGKDQAFMDSASWGPTILAYIAGGGNCGGGTTFGGVMTMPDPLKEHLDNGVNSTTDPGDIDPIPPELVPFL